MINPWLGIGLVMLMLGALQGSVSTIGARYRLHPEIMRKVVHMIMGLICISFPWLFVDVWPVLLLSGIASSWLIATKTLPVLRRRLGQALNCISRSSSGDVWFCIGIGLLFWLTHGNWLLYVVPVLVLTCADAAAALIGVFYGRTFYTTFDGTKSLEGSLAFLIVALVCSYVPLVLFSELGPTTSLLASGALAGSMMLLEALSLRGSDNILVPLGSMLVLKIAINAALPQPVVLCMLVLASVFCLFLTHPRVGRARTLSHHGLITSRIERFFVPRTKNVRYEEEKSVFASDRVRPECYIRDRTTYKAKAER